MAGCCSVDCLRTVSVSVLKRFGVGADDAAGNATPAPQIKVLTRGVLPEGGGKVLFACPVVKQLTPAVFTDPGLVKKIRGNAFTTRSVGSLSSWLAFLTPFLPPACPPASF